VKYPIWNIPYARRSETAEALLNVGYTPLLAAVLAARGFTEPKAAERFLTGAGENLFDPFALRDMDKAVLRIHRAIENREHVAVYGDYDVDGITSTCLLGGYLREKGLKCELYIPDRLEEGYGLNTAAIQALFERGVTLLITVDCGVTACEEAAFAQKLPLDLVITDHHECRESLPEALAVVDPRRDSAGAGKELAGVGVVFMLICALEGDTEACLARYCDLAAVGTVADVMPLLGENRVIIRAGLKKLREEPRPGLHALLKEAGIAPDKLSAASISYSLAPRINAAGRLGRSELAVELLLEKHPVAAANLAAQLCELNRSRQKLETDIMEQARDMLPETPEGPIVLASERWHQGVIGIVASHLAETYRLPVVMICLEGEQGKGSCRSFGNFSMFDALLHCAALLEGFGGHPLAAGLTIRRENLEAFRAALLRYFLENPADAAQTLNIDLLLDGPEPLLLPHVEALQQMEPCGYGNPKPLFCLTDALLEDVVPIGGEKHLRLLISKFGQSIDCVYFSCTEKELGLRAGERVDVAFFPQVNEYRAKRSVQLLVTDVRAADYSALCRAILNGAALPPAALAPYKPARRDFTRLWRSLTALDGSREIPCAQLAVTDAICLTVFAELGLLTYELDGGTVRVAANLSAARVDLDDSAILRQLTVNS